LSEYFQTFQTAAIIFRNSAPNISI